MNTKNKKIMVVEDEAITAKLIRHMLKNLGYEVCAAISLGEEVLKKAEETQPDLILMDILLKGEMSGIEAAEQLHTFLDIPVVYLTAYTDESTLQKAKVTDPFGYIVKPFEERDLYINIEISLYKYHRIAIEKTLSKISKLFVSQDTVDINCILELLGKSTNVDRVSIFMLHKDDDKLDNPHEWCNIGVESQKDNFHNMDISLFQWGMKKLERGESILVTDTETLPTNECKIKKFFQAKNISCVLAVPIKLRSGTLVGIICFGGSVDCKIGDDDIRILQVVSEMLSNYFERKASEEALRRSEQLFRSLIENTIDVLIILNNDGNITYRSLSFANMLGDKKENLVGKTIFEFIHSADIDDVRERFFKMLQSNSSVLSLIFRVLHKDGSWHTLDAVFKNFISDPIIAGIVVNARDITERIKLLRE